MQLNFDNRGGITRLYAIPTEDILRIRNNWGFGSVTPELNRRDRIIELPYYIGLGYQFNEEQTLTDNGHRYAVDINGIVPAHLMRADDIETLRHGMWMVLHQDARGRIRLSGTIQIPLVFTSKSGSGASAKELNGDTFSFSAIEENASPDCYIPDIRQL